MPIATPENRCGTCRFWSELLARTDSGQVTAMCLEEAGPFFGKYRATAEACPFWKKGDLGAVDTPGFDGTEYDAADQFLDTRNEGCLANG